MTLIALIGSVVLVRAKPMLDHYRFNHSFSRLKRELALSKRLAMTATTDIEFHLEQKEKVLTCMRKTDEPLNLKETLNTPINIPYIRMEENKKAMILFTANGWVQKDSVVSFSLGNQKKTIDASKSLD